MILRLRPPLQHTQRLARIERRLGDGFDEATQMGPLVSPRHELAAFLGPIPTSVLARHTQLVLTDRSELSRGREFGVFSPRTWRLADLGAKHEFLRAGLGWGSMPLESVAADLASGALMRITLEDMPPESFVIAMSAVYRTESPPGPAGRWLIDRLKQHPGRAGTGGDARGRVNVIDRSAGWRRAPPGASNRRPADPPTPRVCDG